MYPPFPLLLSLPHSAVLQEAGEWAGDGVIEVPAQENDPSCATDLCDLGRICEALLNATATHGGDAVAALAAVSARQHQGRCLASSLDDASLTAAEARLSAAFDQAAASSSSAEPAARLASSALSWSYQTCTEWGFYQTCERGSRCPFVQGYHNVTQALRMCQVLFQIDQAAVEEQVQARVFLLFGKKQQIFLVVTRALYF